MQIANENITQLLIENKNTLNMQHKINIVHLQISATSSLITCLRGERKVLQVLVTVLKSCQARYVAKFDTIAWNLIS